MFFNFLQLSIKKFISFHIKIEYGHKNIYLYLKGVKKLFGMTPLSPTLCLLPLLQHLHNVLLYVLNGFLGYNLQNILQN